MAEKRNPGQTYNVVPDEMYHEERYHQPHATSEPMPGFVMTNEGMQYEEDPREVATRAEVAARARKTQ